MKPIYLFAVLLMASSCSSLLPSVQVAPSINVKPDKSTSVQFGVSANQNSSLFISVENTQKRTTFGGLITSNGKSNWETLLHCRYALPLNEKNKWFYLTQGIASAGHFDGNFRSSTIGNATSQEGDYWQAGLRTGFGFFPKKHSGVTFFLGGSYSDMFRSNVNPIDPLLPNQNLSTDFLRLQYGMESTVRLLPFLYWDFRIDGVSSSSLADFSSKQLWENMVPVIQSGIAFRFGNKRMQRPDTSKGKRK